jgi:hypothetical protein
MVKLYSAHLQVFLDGAMSLYVIVPALIDRAESVLSKHGMNLVTIV